MAEHVTVTVTRLRGTGRDERGDMSANLGGGGARSRTATDSSRQLLKGSTAVKMLDMPLGTKLPPLPGCDILIYNTDFCEKVHQPSSGFNLDDPRCRLLQTEYKTLQSPHLSSYHKRKNMLRKLKKEDYITKDNKFCSWSMSGSNMRRFPGDKGRTTPKLSEVHHPDS
uniref:Fibrous sheath-interacting protein 2-like n=1 Tax=Geotrypetes seraphini TaxID=260995 RepID=A0A6P8RCZ0_GEOSA|nr:fibrous sheath-interacting protein 2-like [Geotrypetes seraphini]